MRSGRSGHRVGSRSGLSTRGREWEAFVVGGVENQLLCGRGRVRGPNVLYTSSSLLVAVACLPGR